MSRRRYLYGWGVFTSATTGALMITDGFSSNGVPWNVCIGIYLSGLSAAVFTSAVTSSN